MDCNTCKNGRRLQLGAKMNWRGYKTYTWAAEQLAWNDVDSHWPISVDWTGGAIVKAQSLRSCQMNKCHFTIIMSCVQSTLRNIRQVFGQIGLSQKFRLRITFAFGHTLFFTAWIKFEIFIIFWLRHVFIITFVIIIYKKIFQNIFLSAQWIVIFARMIVACSLERIWIA